MIREGASWFRRYKSYISSCLMVWTVRQQKNICGSGKTRFVLVSISFLNDRGWSTSYPLRPSIFFLHGMGVLLGVAFSVHVDPLYADLNIYVCEATSS